MHVQFLSHVKIAILQLEFPFNEEDEVAWTQNCKIKLVGATIMLEEQKKLACFQHTVKEQVFMMEVLCTEQFRLFFTECSSSMSKGIT